MSLSAAVVAHPVRAHEATRLTNLLGAELFMDSHRLGEWPNHRRALAWAADQDATHTLIVEDDAVVPSDLIALCQQAITHRPDDLLGLYVGRLKPLRIAVANAVAAAEATQASWITHDWLLWGVAVIVPTATIPVLLEVCDQASTPYDTRLGRAWARTQGRPIQFPWPSLVDHADTPSVIERRGPRQVGRVAHRVGVPTWIGGTVPV